MNQHHFGYKLRDLRRRLGKSQVEVASEIAEMFSGEIRISQTTLSVLEQSEMAPRQEVLQVLADYFDVPITYFFEDKMQIDRSDVEQAKLYVRFLQHGDMSQVTHSFAHSEANANQDEQNRKLSQMLKDIDYEENDN